MTEVGLRELRQHASELVRRAEAGDDITITVSGRPAVRLVAARRRRWRSSDEIQELFDSPGDPTWYEDRDLIDNSLRDPWEGI